jgi:signal-transduction protein with cAMP-binding, CBS, and nucleotidyltransferase domain
MISTSQWKQIGLDTEIWEAMEEMDRDGVNQLPVMSDGKIEGMLTREDIISYLKNLRELGR